MSSKKILSVGIELASDDVEECEFDSNTSLLDWDIVLFRPDISAFSYAEHFQGKPWLPDSSSFQLKERSEHWRREIKDAVQGGKTVSFICLALYRYTSIPVSAATPEQVETGKLQPMLIYIITTAASRPSLAPYPRVEPR